MGKDKYTTHISNQSISAIRNAKKQKRASKVINGRLKRTIVIEIALSHLTKLATEMTTKPFLNLKPFPFPTTGNKAPNFNQNNDIDKLKLLALLNLFKN